MAIAGSIGGISIPIVALIAIFAKEQLAIAAWIVGALAVMGVILGAMALKKEKKD
ncbi:MAG TPA: hypothetical protein VM223_19740 [Planctomycetota bacterium]|nr:hypothetical protein [Planctomycetota bacterium]